MTDAPNRTARHAISTHPALKRTPDQMTAYAQRVYQTVRAEVAAYRDITDSDVDRDFAQINRRNVELYFRMLAEDRALVSEDLIDLESAAARRLHQAVPLEAIFHSYHVGLRVMWECLLEQAEGLDLGHMAILTLDYADRVTNAAARAYLLERERISRSQQEATRLFFTRLFSGDFTDEPAVLREAQSLGYDLARTHIVVLVTASLPQGQASASVDMVLAEVRDHLERFFPDSAIVLMRAGLLFAVPGDSVQHIIASVKAGVDSTVRTSRALAVSLGTPRAGVHGLISSFHEARRAQALGAILTPAQAVYRYDELRLFDLFKEGEPVDAFVAEVLGKLVLYDTQRQSRLLETLNALFSSALNRKVAARRLGVHPNTLSYRIHRIEELMDGSLLSGEFCFRSQLALKLLPLSRFASGKRDAAGTTVIE